MRSRAKAVALAVLIGLLSPPAPAADAVKSAPPTDTAISPASMDAAVAHLRLDPNLGGQTKVRTLRWVTKSHPRPPSSASPSWMIGLFNYAGQFGGLLLWIAGAAAAAIAAVWILRLLKSVEPRSVPTQPDVDSRRVLDLDIRPDTLPDDVSGAHHTEREVLKTVKGALDEVRARYFADLVAIWQRVVYAGEAVAPDAVLPLCAGFSTYFDPPPP